MAKQAQKLFRVGAASHEVGVHSMTARRWIRAGRIRVCREMRIPLLEIERLLVLYGGVSGHGQKDDPETQVDRLQTSAKAERKGHEFLETLFSCSGVTLTVFEPGNEKTTEQELTGDLLALIALFSGRLYGMRSHKQKELLHCAHAVLTSP